MGSRTYRRPVFLVFLVTGLSWLLGCDQEVEVRSYQEVMVAPSPVGALFDSIGDENAEDITNESWRWVAPVGWDELPADRLRLARFGLPEGGESTVVVLTGDAGGVEANVQRWLTQLGLELSPERLDALLGGAVSVRADLNFTVFDFTALVPSRDQKAFLTAIASIGGETMFVKAEAPAGVLMEQRSAFVDLLNSLGPRSAVSKYDNEG